MGLEFEKYFINDRVIRALSHKTVKEINEVKDQPSVCHDNIEDIGISGIMGNLRLIEIQKNNGKTVEYFTKTPVGTDTFSPINECLASTILQIMGCETPKNKIMYSGSPDSLIITGSKKVDKIIQFGSELKIKDYLDALFQSEKKAQMSGIDFAGLMAGAFLLGDNDENESNYYRKADSSRVGKIDHDWSFRSRTASYNPPNMASVPSNAFLMKLTGKSYPPMEFYQKLMIQSDYIDKEAIDTILQEPIKVYLLKAFVNAAQNIIEMPKAIKDYLFSEKFLFDNEALKNTLKSSGLDRYVTRYIGKLKGEFEQNISELEIFIQEPLRRMQEMDLVLKDSRFLNNFEKINFTKSLEAFEIANSKNITLNDLKTECKKKYMESFHRKSDLNGLQK